MKEYGGLEMILRCILLMRRILYCMAVIHEWVAGQSKCNCGKVKCTVVPRGCIWTAVVAFNRCRQAASPPWRVLPFGLVARFCASTPKTTGRVQPAVPRRQPPAACNAPPTPAKPRSSLTARPPRRLAATPSATCAPVRPVLHSAVAMSYNAHWPFETKGSPAHRASMVCGL